MPKDITYVEPLNEELVKRVFRDDITLKEQNEISQKILERFSYVVSKMFEILEQDWNWFDFDNENPEDEMKGYFDAARYQTDIYYVGEFEVPHFEFNKYANTVPLTWIYTNFEDGLKEEYEAYKSEYAANKANEAGMLAEEERKRALMHAAIKTKLSPEELRYVKLV